ncbi:MAG TPA: GAF domain-containing protein [Methylomirabilota bacterium]|nr:GAF domain-containing protein [Methylomirabilota bacterium]
MIASGPVVRELETGASWEEGLQRALRRLLTLTGATAGALAYRPDRAEAQVVTALSGRAPRAVEDWLARRLAGPPARGLRLARVAPAGVPERTVLLRVPLGPPRRARAELALLGRLTRTTLPRDLPRELGLAVEQAWRHHREMRRMRVATELTRLGRSGEPLDAVYRAFAEGVAGLVSFDSIGVSLIEAEGREFTIVDLPARTLGQGARRDTRMPLEGTLLAQMAASGTPVRVDDLAAATVPPLSRQALAARGYRSALLVPLMSRGTVAGGVMLTSRRPAAFDDADGEVVGGLALPLASAIDQRRLHEDSRRHADQTRALLQAGRAVSASLDIQQTIRVILDEARRVLGVESCSVATLEPATGLLTILASLDLPHEMLTQIQMRAGEGITGRAVSEGRPVKSADLFTDGRVQYPDIPRLTRFRSMLAVPLRVGDRITGTLSVFRRDVHHFSASEEELLLALADQAAIALEHARLYTQLEGMVAERTRELDGQKRFVEVVLETLPLGVFVLDTELRVVRANRHAARVLGCGEPAGARLTELMSTERATAVEELARGVLAARRVASTEVEMMIGDGTKLLRLTAAPIEPSTDHLVLLVEDITLAKRLERQMLLTERLTTAGRLAAGVAHELNNPLATIAGCAESLLARSREGTLAHAPAIEEFRQYLGLIEEEAYRCKEITASLLQFVREPGSRRAPADLNALVLKTIDLLSHQSRFKDRQFASALDPELPLVTINEGQLRQVFLGIAANALEAMGGEGTLHVRSRRLRDEVEVEFEDEGPGISDELLGRIFDAFFTTKPPGQGTGLGLAIAQGIVTDHGGRIEVTSRVGKGSVFRVVLPV